MKPYKLKLGAKVTFRDGRQGVVERQGIATTFIRDEKDRLVSVGQKSGWARDGNWKNDLEKSPR